MGGHRLQARAERRVAGFLRHWRDRPHPTGWAAHRQAPVLGYRQRQGGLFDPLGQADELGGQVPVQSAAAT